MGEMEKMAEKIDCVDLSDSGSSSPSVNLQEIQEIAQVVDSIEISDDCEETELERLLKKNEYFKRLKKDREFVEILDKPDESLLPKPSTSKQEDIQIIGKKRGCSMISTKPLEPKTSQSVVQLTQTKRKINPGDIFRKTYFLGSDVQREKIGNVTKKLHYYKA